MPQGEKVILRSCEPADLEMLLHWENDTTVWKITGTYIPFSKRTLEKYLDTVHDLFSDRQFRFIFCEKASKKPIGIVDLFDFEPHHLRAGVGILVGDQENRSAGYGKDALQALITYCREIVGLRILYCYILVDNVNSIKLFEGCGFKKVATLEKWHRRQNELIDEHMYILYL
ncbi:MAG: GNAT family N-acetyltransferase [Flavobacteriales bacterium]